MQKPPERGIDSNDNLASVGLLTKSYFLLIFIENLHAIEDEINVNKMAIKYI